MICTWFPWNFEVFDIKDCPDSWNAYVSGHYDTLPPGADFGLPA